MHSLEEIVGVRDNLPVHPLNLITDLRRRYGMIRYPSYSIPTVPKMHCYKIEDDELLQTISASYEV